jgi:hypothetical protein
MISLFDKIAIGRSLLQGAVGTKWPGCRSKLLLAILRNPAMDQVVKKR